MKRILFSSFLLLGFHLMLSAQQTEKEVLNLLCHKWKVTHIEHGGQKIEMPAELGEAFLIFKADSTITEIDPSETYKGKWTYDHKGKTITTDDKDGIQKHKLIKLTTTELIITMKVDDETSNMILKRVD
jgi:lipocalin-like protein